MRESSTDAFDAARIRALLTRLGAQAASRGVQLQLTLVGGAAIALTDSARRTTRDVDIVRALPSVELVLAIAREVGLDEGLRDGWLSDDASRFAPSVAPGQVVIDAPGIEARVVTDVQLLAMKLDAMRDDVDRADAILLARRLGFERMSAELAIAPFVSPERYRRACLELDDIWEEVEHAAR